MFVIVIKGAKGFLFGDQIQGHEIISLSSQQRQGKSLIFPP